MTAPGIALASHTAASAKPRGCTFLRLRKVARRMTQRYDAHLQPSGLRITQFSLLAALAGDGAFTVSNLASRMAMDRTTLTRNLKPLADRGLLRLGTCADARCRSVALTDAGRTAFAVAVPFWRQAQKEILALVGAADLEHLHRLLDHTLALLESD